MSKSKKKKKIPWKSVVLITVFLGVSFALGWFGGSALAPLLKELPKEDFLLGLIGIYIFLFLFTFLQTVIHEAGHLFFGLLTGYKYSSFRIGSFIWVKLDGKLRLKRYSLSGTGGQCLMAPPDMVDGKYPNVLYNFGGCIANFIVSIIPLIVVLIFWQPTYFNFIVLIWVLIGLFDALANGIPMKVQGMPNDGHNALSLNKSPMALHAFWLQMKINEQVALGKRIKDLPEEWFVMPEAKEMQNSLVATIGVLVCNRLVDSGRYEEAAEQMEWIIKEKTGMVGIHRHMLNTDRLYCELVGENRPEKLKELYTDELKNFWKAMKKSPSTFRMRYLYAKYVEKDEKAAETALAGFEKVAKTYPYPHEIVGEREMIAYAEERLQTNM